jgi:opacity protein-like surface antigen
VGLGASHVSFQFGDGLYPGIDAWGLAWEAGGGLDLPISDYNISLGIFYRYRSAVALTNNWHPVPAVRNMTEEEQFTYYSEWEVSYHAIGIELRFGGVR